MPKAFSDEERREARRRILRAARSRFSRLGYRKANVAEIARAAGVGKGTIYLFFPSKAEIFVDVLEEVEREMRVELREELDRAFETPRQALEFFFHALLTRMVDHPLLWVVVDPTEAQALFRDLGPEVRRLDAADEEFFRTLVAEWREAGWLKDVEPEVLGGAARGLYAVTLHRDLLGGAYRSVVDLLVQALAGELAARP